MSYPKETKDFYFFAPLKEDLRTLHQTENLYLRGKWSKVLEQAISQSGVSDIFVQDWGGQNLNFLEKFSTQIKRLIIETPSVEDISVVNQLRNLRELSLHHRESVEQIDFSRLRALRVCVLEVRENAGNIGDCPLLEDLTLIALKVGDLKAFASLKQLRSLTLQEVPLNSLDGIEMLQSLEEMLMSQVSVSDLSGLEHLTGLKTLTLAGLRKLTDLSALARLERLEKLSIESCKKVQDYAWIGQIRSLKELNLAQVGKIQTLKPLLQLKNLEKLTLLDDTDISDGNMGGLLGLPKLRLIAFTNRRHYSHRLQDIRKSLESR